MTLYLALSCLQGRLSYSAALELVSLSPDIGLQLTPGCVPSSVNISSLCNVTKTHQGYTQTAMRTRVWSDDGKLVWKGDSVHTPKIGETTQFDIGNCDLANMTLETMYPGYVGLSCGIELDDAMNRNIPLAVDISHIDIQRHHGVISNKTINRLFSYNNIQEVHVSKCRNGHDSHLPISINDFGVEWAKEMYQKKRDIMLECYMHKLSKQQRQDQIGIITI